MSRRVPSNGRLSVLAASVAGIVAATLLLPVPAASAAAPARPVLTHVTPRTTSIVFSWVPVKGATSYVVCLRRSTKDAACAARTAHLTSTRTRLDGLTRRSGVDYVATLVAYNRSGRRTSAVRSVDLAPLPTQARSVKHTQTLSSATFTWKAATHATDYVLCLRSQPTDTRCLRTSRKGPALKATLTGLTSRPGTDYYAYVISYNSDARTRSVLYKLDLAVAPVATTTLGTATTTSVPLTWTTARNAERYLVEAFTSSDLKSGRRTVATTSPRATLTGLVPGERYWVQVRGRNGTTAGKPSPAVTRSLPTLATTVQLATYNLCGQDKCRDSANRRYVKAWPDRKKRAGVAARATRADILSTQESGDQDTNFITQLPGFKRAAYLHAKSLFYRTSKYTLLKSGGLTLDAQRKRYAVWALLRDRTTRTPFIVVDPHLEPAKGRTGDGRREAQMRTLLRQVSAVNPDDLPVVYAGDFNSNGDNADQKKYKGGYDAVAKVFGLRKIPNTLTTARRTEGDVQNTAYNSANQGLVTPIKNGDHVDQVWASRAIGVKVWQLRPDMKTAKSYRTPFASDHNPLRVVLVVPGLREKS